jgi:hypothetical protein
MLTVVWKPAEFHVVVVLPKGVKFCSAYYLCHIMDAPSAAPQPYDQHPFRKLAMHADNAPVHK